MISVARYVVHEPYSKVCLNCHDFIPLNHFPKKYSILTNQQKHHYSQTPFMAIWYQCTSVYIELAVLSHIIHFPKLVL